MKKPSQLLFLFALTSCSHVSPIFEKKEENPKSIRHLTSGKKFKEVEKKHFTKVEVKDSKKEDQSTVSSILSIISSRR